MRDHPTEQYEFTGDWIVPTQAKLKELLNAVQAMTFPIVDCILQKPAIRSLNFDMCYPSGSRNICSLQIVDRPIDGDNISFDEGTNSAVYLRLFTIEGRTATFEFGAYLWMANNLLHYSVSRHEDDEEDSYKSAESLTLQYFSAFLVIQFMMLHGADKISFRKEYRKALKPARASQLVAPYTQPGKVRILDISVTEDEVRECIRRASAVHTWHCPAWGVRGHYRHCKNGRVSYVKPYVKGKNKAAYAGREYTLPDGGLIVEVMK